MRSASVRRRAFNWSTDSPASAPSENARFIRSIAQNRLTAVGRVSASRSQLRWNSVVNCLVPVALLRAAPSARPIAAHTPIAGAPRITMVLIALATSLTLLQVT